MNGKKVLLAILGIILIIIGCIMTFDSGYSVGMG